MSTPGTLRIERPYDSPDAYLDGDAWTVSRSDVLLVDAGSDELGPGAAVRFEIALATGEAVVRGEGRVVEAVAPCTDRPGGLRVRFQKLDAESKAMLRRALEIQKRLPTAAAAAPPEPSGIRHRVVGPIAVPENRDMLLARLRERASRVTIDETKRRTAGE